MEKYRRVISPDTEKWSQEKVILEKYEFFVWCNRLEAVSGRYFRENLWQLSWMKFILLLICIVSPLPLVP